MDVPTPFFRGITYVWSPPIESLIRNASVIQGASKRTT